MSEYSTPIVDYLKEYGKSDITRLHMPGHKGTAEDDYLCPSFFKYDITEISGADDLYNPKGIIRESEENASAVFGAKTIYSAEGSSQAVKAMLFLAKLHWLKNIGEASVNEAVFDRPAHVIVVGNYHKALYHASRMLNVSIDKIDIEGPGLTNVSEKISDILSREKDVIGVYVTYPDYFGNVIDLKELKNRLTEFNLPLLTDGAHSAYFKFLDEKKYPRYIHPTDCMADICCASAHKTLPTLTGAAYLHLSESFSDVFDDAKHAMDIFGSSSPSYLILASLDEFNARSEELKKILSAFCEKTDRLKKEISDTGFNVADSDPLRIVVRSDEHYEGRDFANALKANKCEAECFDKQYVIMMLSPYNTERDLERILESFRSIKNGVIKTDGPESSDFNCLKNFS